VLKHERLRAATTADSISCSADALRPNVFSKSLEDSMASNHPSPTYLLGITIYRYLLYSIHPIQMSVYFFGLERLQVEYRYC